MIKEQFRFTLKPYPVLFVALYLLSASLFPVSAIASEKSTATLSGMIAMVKLAAAYNSSTAQLNQDEIAAMREEAYATLDDIFQKIDQSGITIQDLNKYEQILPHKITDALSTLISVSGLNLSTEDKIAAMMGVFASCESYLYTFLVLIAFGFVLGGIPIIGDLIGLAQLAYAFLTVLCYLGLI
jgi:hypothetical protein